MEQSFKMVVADKQIVWKTALTSRILLILLQYIFNVLMPDHESDGFRYPHTEENTITNKLVNHVFGGFLRWDAHYFLHISTYGYTYEQMLAFFPLYPLLVRYLSGILSSFIFFLDMHSLTLLVSIGANIVFFILSALSLYELSVTIVGRELAYKATILFCYNPASVFFSAPYTESIFSYLSFKAMLNCVLLYKKYVRYNYVQVLDVVYVVPVCLSTFTRSNGVLNIGFLAYALICLYFEKIKLKQFFCDKLLCTAKFFILIGSLCVICMIPFVAFQYYAFKDYCQDFEVSLPSSVMDYANARNFVLPGTFSKHHQSWCFSRLPLAYSYVQEHYWNVGFMGYYELKQIPNFLLASPLIFLILSGALKFFQQCPKGRPAIFDCNVILQNCSSSIQYNPAMVVFVIHATVLTVFCVLNIHVQVTTRMLCSASPVLYWFSAYDVPDLSVQNLFNKLLDGRYSAKTRCLLGYYGIYFIIGTLMFCNFLPWT